MSMPEGETPPHGHGIFVAEPGFVVVDAKASSILCEDCGDISTKLYLKLEGEPAVFAVKLTEVAARNLLRFLSEVDAPITIKHDEPLPIELPKEWSA